jgi:hypothetical protein
MKVARLPFRMLVATLLLALVGVAAGALEIVILEPKPGAALPAAAPVVVKYTAKGGPFVYVVLNVDGTDVKAESITSTKTELTGEIGWERPTEGRCTVTLSIFDAEKRVSQATVTIQVGEKSGPAARPAEPARPGEPARSASGVLVLEPARRQLILDAFRREFGLALTAPPIARKDRWGAPDDPWVSVAYIGDLLYQVNLYADDHIETRAVALTARAVAPAGMKLNDSVYLKPVGTYRMLVVFVDYGNLGVSRAEVQEALRRATADVNAMFAERSRAAGLAKPILRIETEARFIAPPAGLQGTDYLLRVAQVKPLTGVDPAPFDLLAQVDLDRGSTAMNWSQQKYGTASFGTAMPNAVGPRERMNIWVSIDDPRWLTQAGDENRLVSVLLTHEVLHDMGYGGTRDMHEWPGGDAASVDATDMAAFSNWPAYLLGWTDTDGDGVVEILDAKPYGLK